MSESIEASPKRPVSLSIVCVLAFIGVVFIFAGLLFMPQVRSEISQQYGASAVPMAVFGSVLGIAALAGLWQMKRWGFYLYIANSFIGIFYGFAVGIKQVSGYVMPLVVIAICAIHFKKMR